MQNISLEHLGVALRKFQKQGFLNQLDLVAFVTNN